MPEVSPPSAGRPHAILTPAPGEALDRLNMAAILELYRRHGALLLRGFGTDLPAFTRFARVLCPTAAINESPGRETLDPANCIRTVNEGSEAFALHPELSREPWKPDAALFHCLSTPAGTTPGDGATTLCDGVALAEALPPEVREGLAGRRLVYVMNTWPELLRFWLGTETPDDALLAHPPTPCPYGFWRLGNGRIVRHFSRPALHRPMFADRPAFGNFLLFARFNNGRGDFPLLDDLKPVPEDWLQAIRATGERLSAAVDWQPGDVLVLDNTRFLHGRNAISHPGERRIATYFGYLAGAPRDPDEIAHAPWRQGDFAPPLPPQAA